LNGVSFDIDGGAKTTLPRSGNGTFVVATTMYKPHTIDVSVVVQYHFTISGGFNTQLSSKSPTGDGFYDSGSATTVTADNVWNLVVNKSRQNLISYTLDGKTTNITRVESGTFTTPTITFDNYHNLAINSVVQYFVTFGFTDNSGSTRISPSNLQIDLNGKVQNVTGFKEWLDNGTTFKLASVIWENVDVKPSNQTVYRVEMPSNETIRSRIYDAKLSVTDLLGVPVSGASAQIVLANGTQIVRSTDSGGVISVPLIPRGTFTATVSNLGTTAQVSGDASMHPITDAKVFASYPDVGAIGGVIAAVVIVVVLKFVIRRPGAPTPTP
jgi:hypothetical protein